MVSFTCNACGQTVRKSKVEKHYQTECRDCTVLSCLDCGKDFHGDDYTSHTSCISEAEKYQGKLYKDSNRGQPPKGEKKQQAWLEKVKQAATSSPTTNPRLARLLERLQEYTNIPRKMKKFQNFVKNSLNVRDQKTLDDLWSMFSGIQATTDGTATTGEDAEKKPESSTLEDTTISVDETEVDKVKKKKKSKHSEADNTEAGSAVADESVVSEEDILSSTKKKHKKKRHHNTDSEDVTSNTNQLDIQLLSDSQPPALDESVIKKKKKSKKKSSDQEVQCITDEQDTMEDVQCMGTDNGVEDNINHWVLSITESGPVKKKKKKKDKHRDCNATDNNDVTDSNTMEMGNTDSADVALTTSKQSKCKERTVDDLEDGEMIVVERKKKRKSKTITEDVPVGKKTKLQEADNEVEMHLVKKHKKKKSIE